MWTPERTEKLIALVKKNYHRITGTVKRRGAVWLEISNALKDVVCLDVS